MSDQESIQSEQNLNETLEIQENLDTLILEGLEAIEGLDELRALADQIELPELEEEETPAENESETSADTTNTSMSTSLTNIFGNATALDDAAIASSLSTHKKEDRASMDLKSLNRVKYEATKQLDMIFKVQSALGTSGVTGEENPDLDTTVMATVFAENTHVLDKMSRVIEDYDMVSAIQIRKVADPTATHPRNKYETNYIDLLKEIGTLDLDEVKEYSGDIMKYDVADGVNRQNLVWLLLLVRNNESSSIAALIEPAFEKLDIHHRNGAVYLKMVLDLCFSIDEHVIESLKVYITRFGKNGLSAFEGENVNMAAVEIIAIARRLDQLGELPNDAPKTVLKGLQKVTHNYEFKQTFVLIGNLQNQSVISFSGSTTNAKPLELIETYFEQAKSLYTSAVLRNQWAGRRPNNNRVNNMANNLVLVCWNCGGNHSLKDCKEEKDQAKIQKAKDAFFENKRKAGAPNNRTRGDGGKDKGYSRSGFGGNKGTNGLITTSDGQVYTSCKYGTSADGCGMNQTHSSKYHHQWKANPRDFKLPGTHPFMIALAAGGQCLPASSKGSPSNVANQGAINAAVQQALNQFKSDTAKKLADLETQAASPDVSHAAGMLMKLFQ
jgi:hypothetical protein